MNTKLNVKDDYECSDTLFFFYPFLITQFVGFLQNTVAIPFHILYNVFTAKDSKVKLLIKLTY